MQPEVSAAFGPFEILRVLGEGGTSIVYAAKRDGEELALKVLRADEGLTDSETRRFLAEADQLAKLSHPGVIHVLDAGLLPDGRPYLALPLLRGETLAARLARGPIADALPQFYAAAEAVVALHRAGLLHRDIKPENFFFDDAAGRLVLLDFGIARDPDATASTQTREGQVRGTPAYMAPERFFGVPASEASEVYELATTLHAMLAGSLPWTNGADLDQRLDPKLASTIDPAIASVLRGALAVRAEVRPQTVTALVKALRDRKDEDPNATRTLPHAAAIQRVAALPPPATTTRRMRRRTKVGLASAVAIVAIAAVTFTLVHKVGERYVADLAAPRRVIVVLAPRNISADPDAEWIATAIAERSRLGLSGSLVVPTEQALRELSIETSSPRSVVDADALAKLRVRSGAGLVMSGSYYAQRDQTLRVSFIVQDAVSGVVIASSNQTGSVENLGAVVTRAIGELRTTLGVGPSTTEREKALVDSLPTGGEASREYAEGLACSRRYAPVCAKAHLERAVALAPNSALAHDALSEAHKTLGNDPGARAEAARALELGAQLPEEQHLLLVAHAAVYTAEWKGAITAYQTLVAKWPDDLRYALGLADAQAKSGDTTAAFATLAKARTFSKDPRLDFYEASIADKANDFPREVAAADRLIKVADELGERELGAHARLAKGWASVTLGKLDEAKTALDEALRMFGAEGDRNGTARAVLDLGTLLEQKGDFDGAKKMYEDALSIARDLGNQNTIATTLLDLGQVLAESADPTSARARYEEALGIARSLGDVNLTEETLVNLGSLASKSGDIPSARVAYDEAMAIARQHAHHRVLCAVLVNTSNLEEHEGKVEKSVVTGKQAVEEARLTNEPALVTQSLGALAEHEAQAGAYADALSRFTEVEKLQSSANDKIGLVNTSVSHVGVLQAAGRDAEAVKLATATLALVDEKTDPDNYGWLKMFLAKIELEANRLDTAEPLLEAARGVLLNTGDAELTAEVGITGAELLAAKGQLDRALVQIAKLRADAVKTGADGIVIEADIVAAGLTWEYRKDKGARAKLAELAAKARAKGAGTTARLAELLAK